MLKFHITAVQGPPIQSASHHRNKNNTTTTTSTNTIKWNKIARDSSWSTPKLQLNQSELHPTVIDQSQLSVKVTWCGRLPDPAPWHLEEGIVLVSDEKLAATVYRMCCTFWLTGVEQLFNNSNFNAGMLSSSFSQKMRVWIFIYSVFLMAEFLWFFVLLTE